MNSQPHFIARTLRITAAICVSTLVASVAFAHDNDNDKDGKEGHHFWRKAGMCGHKEVVYSELAATRASNPQVRSFAQMLVADHQAMKDEMMAMKHNERMEEHVVAAGETGPAYATTSSTTVTTTADSTRATSGNPPTSSTEFAATGNATQVDALHNQQDSAPNRYSTTKGNPQAGDTASRPSVNTTDAVEVSAPVSRDADKPVRTNSDTYVATTTTTTDGTVVATDGHHEMRHHRMKDDTEIMNEHEYKSLANKSGSDFDKAYLNEMIEDHKDAIKLFEKEAKDTKDPEAQSYAAKYLPKLRDHLEQAKQLKKSA